MSGFSKAHQLCSEVGIGPAGPLSKSLIYKSFDNGTAGPHHVGDTAKYWVSPRWFALMGGRIYAVKI
jgi:hypothetical protein